MAITKSRTITLAVAVATLVFNTLSSILFHQLPDDPFHLASNFGWYLHSANILSVFGFIGALRQHALSIAIFSNYLIVDTLLSAIPRILILTCLQQFSSSLCSANDFDASSYYTPSNLQTPAQLSELPGSASVKSGLQEITTDWSEDGCKRIITLAQVTLAAGCFAATLLQFVGALYVREYAKSIWIQEVREEEGRSAELDSETADRMGAEEFGLEKP